MEEAKVPDVNHARNSLDFSHLVSDPTEELPSVETYLAFAKDVIRRAGALALSLQPAAEGSLKADNTRVSNADFLVQALIQEAIHARFPTHLMLAEEEPEERAHPVPSPEHIPAVSEGLWIVDPIDGTDSYLRCIPTYSICLGLALKGEPVLGLVYMPVAGDLYWATSDGRAGVNDEPLTPLQPGPVNSDSMLLVTSTIHRYAELNFPGKIRSYGSTAAHLCYVAAGRVDAAVVAGVKIWDIFSGWMLLKAVGGGLYRIDGTPLDLPGMLSREATTPALLAAHPESLRPVLATVRPRRNR